MKKEYTIGLDIGTASVGWAVVTQDNNLMRRRMKIMGDVDKASVKKNFWGVRLFDESETAASTRIKRTARRRYNRRRQRICYLQAIFAEEMNKLDQNFFFRLNESFLVTEDKLNERHPLFGTLEEEVAYHKKYPTIYHLRKELVDSTEKADLRYIYLALAHMIKYRGNFLVEGKLSTENSSIKETFRAFLKAYNQAFQEDSAINKVDETIDVSAALTEKVSPLRKAELVLALFPDEKKNTLFHQLLKMIVGLQGNFKKSFSLAEDAVLQFSKEDYETSLEAFLENVNGEYIDVFESAKQAYHAVILSDILTAKDKATTAKFSAGMVERYDNHQKDLAKLKSFISKHLPEQYTAFFKDISVNGYAGYIGNSKKTGQDDFYSYVRKAIEKIPNAEYFIEKMDRKDFLRKQRTFDNGVIPHQIHLEELEAVIHKQSKYYPFLKEQLTKIKGILTFRIPYYVGPLANGNSDFAWLARKSNEKITPWNLEEVVNLGESATKFISKMTNFDQYLPNEKVLPKHSLLYQKYAVYNELTKVEYKDERGIIHNFSGAEKEKIFTDLFKQKRKVTKKALEQFLRNEYNIDQPTVLGIENSFNASYATYHDFISMGVNSALLEDSKYEETFEEIVKIMTVFEDRRMTHEQLKPFAENFSKEVMKKMERRHYTGWGRLSAKLIHGIYDKQTKKTILDYLMNDDGPKRNINRNLMQLINDDNLSFKAKIQEIQTNSSPDDLRKSVRDLAGSPAIKRGILQSLQIVDELVEIIGYPPKNIVIEMARENQKTSKTRSRLKSLSDMLKDFGSHLLSDHPVKNEALQNDRLYLYYLQNGKDMYTGDQLDLHKVMFEPNYYDIDHIVPQKFTVDNSFDNRVLVSQAANREKSDDVPSTKIIRKMKPFWESLHKSNLISKRKLENLTKAERGGLTEKDKADFIKRQLVETRQITKHVARILDSRYNKVKDDSGEVIRKVHIINLKAALISQFRKDFSVYKVREISDYHHAHDAYLGGVIANTLLAVYPKLAPEFVYGEYPKFSTEKENKATAKKQFYTNIMRFFTEKERIVSEDGEILWDKDRTIAMIKKVISYRQINMTKKLTNRASNEDGKELFKSTIEGRGGKGKNPIKTQFRRNDGSVLLLSIDKYGGYIEEKEAFITIDKGKIKSVKRTEVNHYEKRFKILRNQVFLQKDGFYRTVSSSTESGKWSQLHLDAQLTKYIYLLKRYNDLKVEEKTYIDQNRHLFEKLRASVFSFISKNHLAKLMDIHIPEERSVSQELEVILALLNIASRGTTAKNSYTLEDKKTKAINERIRYTTKKDTLIVGETILIYQSITGLRETYRRLDG
ncbi:type II CRISPR RNA-guided endonuclease Cas9 [Listeria sp. PSOL-1]|uniref:type II CRISPR RNA-guided endonuclease Cas9 n=1 Tax=Listeria sp. PSOL-1 TaxID=1844999 RepID=UPI0013D7AD56|nr:type II CRISPR RNA-guided endonuclease Cas9 [Listeria sp. PSOL-1]